MSSSQGYPGQESAGYQIPVYSQGQHQGFQSPPPQGATPSPSTFSRSTDPTKEVYQGHHAGLEVAPAGMYYPAQYHQPTGYQGGKPETTIFGMRIVTFVLSVALVLVVVVAAVAGGVGGSLATKEAEVRCMK